MDPHLTAKPLNNSLPALLTATVDQEEESHLIMKQSFLARWSHLEGTLIVKSAGASPSLNTGEKLEVKWDTHNTNGTGLKVSSY